MDRTSEIAVVGTGVVGRQLLEALSSEGHAAEHVTVLGSDRSVGEEVELGGETLEVEKATPDAFRGLQVVFLAVPPEVAKTLAPAAQSAGAWVVDLSAAFLADPQVPVVVPSVNGKVLGEPMQGRIVRCPSAVTVALATVLEPLRATFGLTQAVVTAFMGASTAGHKGIGELEQETANLLSGRELEPSHFPHRLAFNLIPQVGAFAASGSTGEELGWRADLMRIWAGRTNAAVDGTAVQVPTFFGHALSLTVRLERAADAGEVRQTLGASDSLKVLDTPADKVYPMPLLSSGDPAVLVGRIRPFAGAKDTFSLFSVIDNAGRGAALNALEVAQGLLAER